MQHVKSILMAALVVLVVMAIVNRVDFLKKVIYPAA